MAFLGSCRRHQNQCLDKANGQHISKKIKKGSRQEFLHQAPRLVWMAICHDLPDSFGWRVHIVSIVSFVFHSDISDPFSIHALGLKMAGATCQWSLKYGESHAPLTSICGTRICIIFLGYLGVLKACATHTSKILSKGVYLYLFIELLSIALDWCSSKNGPACPTKDFVSKYPPSYYHRDPARSDFTVSLREATSPLEIQHKINFASMEKDGWLNQHDQYAVIAVTR